MPVQNVEVNPKRVAIFTTFNGFDAAYSLCRIVRDQLKMLVVNGYKPVVFVSEGFTVLDDSTGKDDEWFTSPNVELRYLPNVTKHNEVKKDETFEQDVDKIYDSFKSVLAGIDVVISHDLVYQPDALKHHFAARKIAKEFPKIKWLHWIHSATSPYTLIKLRRYFTDEYLEVMKDPFPNSFYVFFNNYSKPRICQNFSIPESMVKTVYHPIDIAGFFGVSPLVEKLWDSKNYYSADAILTYPVRLDRGKQVEYVIKVMAALKEFDLSPRITIVDFHSTGGDKVVYRDELKQLAIDSGLSAQEITFTSEFAPKWNTRVSHDEVRDLMLLSNVLMMPSVSESYSLITQEQALCGAVGVVNFDFPPFREIFGPGMIQAKYSSAIDIMNGMDGQTNTIYGPNKASAEERVAYEQDYHKATAGLIAYRLRNESALVNQTRIRKQRNLRNIFKTQIEPLFWG